ncbi:hypothetical protein [Aquimarina sp. 2201CG5-10]|uniref:hypothetical protein n=1 Tax=Aquimarina callyspongiae TaxID=3098150 RepID=UPI002AB40CAF|nr:hypothetical protein [Aquimarina sp. 2201CG5-10]MDY8134331.1 hypothetical protein [Aquimarina sp. 2201CG5-10]
MKNLKELIKYCHIKVFNGNRCPILTKIESQYKNEYNIPHYDFFYYDSMNEEIGKKIADYFDATPHNSNNIYVKAAYEQLSKEVIDQFLFLQESEMKIDFEPFKGDGEPYKNSFEMLMDIHNYHMYFFKTESGFGESIKNEDNMMLRKTGIFIKDYELLVNDIFRIVHDVFGHASYGYSFGPIGEDLAWMTHSKMFSPLARAAITTETRGQNCWVNFGPHLRNLNGKVYEKNEEKWIPPSQRPFAEQKMILLPKEISGVELHKNQGEVLANHIKDWNPLLSITHEKI